jgi:hypothetical protein
MKKEKAARVVKWYALIIGWFIISPILLIPGYMLSKRLEQKRIHWTSPDNRHCIWSLNGYGSWDYSQHYSRRI